MKYIYTAFLLFFSLNCQIASAKNFEVTMNDSDGSGNKLFFSQELLHISAGDEVTWIPNARGHNIEFVASPNNLQFRSSSSEKVTLKFEIPGIYYYWCSPHKSAGMIGLIVVNRDLSNIQKIKNAKAPGRAKIKLTSLLNSL